MSKNRVLSFEGLGWHEDHFSDQKLQAGTLLLDVAPMAPKRVCAAASSF